MIKKMTAAEAEAARAALAAFDDEARETARKEALAPFLPLVGVVDGEDLAKILAKVRLQLPLITDERVSIHLRNLVEVGTRAQDTFKSVVFSLQAQPAVPAPE